MAKPKHFIERIVADAATQHGGGGISHDRYRLLDPVGYGGLVIADQAGIMSSLHWLRQA